MLLRVNRTVAKSVCLATLIAVLLTVFNADPSWAKKIPEVLAGDIVWNSTGNPHLIEKDLLIPPGTTLVVEPGTKVLFGAGVSLIIRGSIQAVGTLENPILFSSVNSDPAPGSWGNICFNEIDQKIEVPGRELRNEPSVLKYCIVEYGGEPSPAAGDRNRGGAILSRSSSPRIENVIMRYNRSWRGGAIYCLEFSSPGISECLFLENEAVESGGAIACFFYSNPVIENNTFQGNRAGRRGGAIYCSFSSPRISGNIIENSLSEIQGGALFASNSIAREPLLFEKNVLLSNSAHDGSHSIYLTAGFNAEIRDNCFFADGGIEVYIDAITGEPDLSRNCFGIPGKADLEPKMYVAEGKDGRRTETIKSVLISPPREVPNAPSDITSIDLYADQSYTRKLTGQLQVGAAIHIEVRALDQNPYHEDWIQLDFWTDSHPRELKMLAWETGPSTGIYRFESVVQSSPDVENATITSNVGDILHCRIGEREEFEINRQVGLSDASEDGSQSSVGEASITE